MVIILRRVMTFFFVPIIYIMLSRNGYFVRFFTFFFLLPLTFVFFPVFGNLWKKVHLFSRCQAKGIEVCQISDKVQKGFKVCRFLNTFCRFANIGKGVVWLSTDVCEKLNIISVTSPKRYWVPFCQLLTKRCILLVNTIMQKIRNEESGILCHFPENKEWKIKVSLI